MNQRKIYISFVAFIAATLIILIEFGLSILAPTFVVTFLLAILTIIIACHILLEKTLNYRGCFLLSLFLLVITASICFITYQANETTFFSYHNFFRYKLPINWFIPMCYCLFRNLLDRGPKFLGFKHFFYKMSLVFGLCSVSITLYLMFINPQLFQQTIDNDYNWIPFITIATYIETFIYNPDTFPKLSTYILPAILLYLPFGFYIRLFGKNLEFITRTFIMASIPFTIEALQYFLHIGIGDIDDILLALIGSFLGALLFYLINSLYLFKKGDDFLYERSGYSFSRRF